MNNIRILIIAFLAYLPKSKSEQFNKAFELYRNSPQKNTFVERKLNQAGLTEEGLKSLLYDLQKLHDIQDKEIVSYRLNAKNQEVEKVNLIKMTQHKKNN